MVRAVGLRGPKAAGAGEAWALADSAEAALAVGAADSEAAEADSAVVDLAGGGNVSEILFAKYNEIQLWRKSNVACSAEPKSFGCSFRDASQALFLAVCLLVSCGKAESPKIEQKTFSSPAEAGDAFLAAAKAGDQSAILAIFGPDSNGVLFSGDAVKDKDSLQEFVAAYDQMHRWREIKVGGEMLYVGADNFPFPIPLGKNPSGQWVFDTAAGKDEILARRIGKDELTRHCRMQRCCRRRASLL